MDAVMLLGDIALELSEQIGDKEATAKASMMVFTFLHPWKNGMRSCRAPMLYSHRFAMESGDSESGVICLFNIDCIDWCTSLSPLHRFAKELERHAKFSFEYQFPRAADITMLFARGLRRLCASKNPAFAWLDAPITYPRKFNFENNEDDPMVQCFHNVLELQSHLLLGEHEKALKCADSMPDVTKACMGQPYVPRALFYRALTYFSMAGDVRKHHREANRALMELKTKFVDRGNVNCVHMLTLLDAEVARVKKDDTTARQKYAEAILLATRSRHIHDVGISNEYAGRFYLQIQDMTRASYHIEQAIKSYTDWGADAVAQRLQESHSNLITNHSVGFLSMGKTAAL